MQRVSGRRKAQLASACYQVSEVTKVCPATRDVDAFGGRIVVKLHPATVGCRAYLVP